MPHYLNLLCNCDDAKSTCELFRGLVLAQYATTNSRMTMFVGCLIQQCVAEWSDGSARRVQNGLRILLMAN
jgi:hypothetical protein